MLNYKEKLNEDQYNAVMHESGPALIIAGAGTGKTTTVMYRIAKLVEVDNIDPQTILFLTFTKVASEELKRRVKDVLNDTNQIKLAGGTFHSWGVSLLRKYAKVVNLTSSFSIYDPDDCTHLIKLIIGELGIPKKRMDDSFELPTPDQIYSRLSSAKNNNKDVVEHFSIYKTRIDDILNILNAFERRKKMQNIIDYDDILHYTYRLLSENDDILYRASQYYSHIIVDEYQDTNFIQNDILKLFLKYNDNIFVVGDDAQSIYKFRGAMVQNILNFKGDFGAEIYNINTNYRSTKGILDFTNEFSKCFKENFKKKLIAGTGVAGTKVKYFVFDNQEREANYICEKIVKVLNENDKNYNDFAILSRYSYLSYAIQIELLKYQIPFKVFGGMKFFEKKHIKDLICFLRMIFNLQDELSVFRTMSLLAGFGEKSVVTIMNSIKEHGLPSINYGIKLKTGDDIMQNKDLVAGDISAKLEQIGYESKKKIAKGGYVIKGDMIDVYPSNNKHILRIYLEFGKVNLINIIDPKTQNPIDNTNVDEAIIPPEKELPIAGLELNSTQKTSMTSFLNFMKIALELKDKKDNNKLLTYVLDYYRTLVTFRDKKVDNELVTLTRLIKTYSDIDEFLQNFALEPAPTGTEEDETLNELQSKDNKEKRPGFVTVSTIHSAKGREWDCVFVVGVREGVFPDSKSDTPDDKEEDKRLFYVACTRAKTKLILTASNGNYWDITLPRCSFVDNISDKYLQKKSEFTNRKDNKRPFP